MKELKMFPQITEETEENLLHLEELSDNHKNPPMICSAPVSPLPQDSPSPFDYENNVPSILPTIIAEDVDVQKKNNKHNNNNNNNTVMEQDDFVTPPPRIRMRSLSGGAYRINPIATVSGRIRRQSGDDVLTGVMSPARKAALFELPERFHFRPRSKSDSKGKRPTFLSTLKNSFFSTSASSHLRKNSLEVEEPLEPLQPGGDYRQRSRSGSETKGGAMSKVIDMFRNRSNSLSVDLRGRRPSGNSTTLPASALTRRYSVEPEKRKHGASHFLHPQHRSLDLTLSDRHLLEPRSSTIEADVQKVDYENVVEDMYFPKFFDCNTCYNVMPKSAKMVVLDANLTVERAFHCLVGNEIRAAPIWDPSRSEFIGMLTITDFIDVLILYYESSEEQMKHLEEQTICMWRSVTNKEDNFIHIHPDKSLTDAIKALVQKQVHRLPVFEPLSKNVLYILTHKRILKFLNLFIIGEGDRSSTKRPGVPSYMHKTIRDLGIGTYENIATATLEITVIEALKIFKERKVSALPVIQDGKVINIYAKFDVLALANEKSYRNLDITIKQALEQRGEVYEEVLTCTLDNTLDDVIGRIVKYEVHRIVVVDSKHAVIGMISLSDIMKYLVLRPLGLLNQPISPVESSTDIQGQVKEGTSSDVDLLCENFASIDLELDTPQASESETASTSSEQTLASDEKNLSPKHDQTGGQHTDDSIVQEDSDVEGG